MSVAVALYRGAATAVRTGAVSLVAVYGGVLGGRITNPASSIDQGIRPLSALQTYTVQRFVGPFDTYGINDPLPYDGNATQTFSYVGPAYGPPEPLYVDLTGPADLAEGPTTRALQPGETFVIPPGCAVDVWVNAATSGHRFAAVALQPATQYPPTPYAGAFPPGGPTTKLTTIPSYLYEQYQSDDDLAALVAAYNGATQSYVDWFNALHLPVYTELSGGLLDWVGRGLYGLERPTLYSGLISSVGPFDTTAYDTIAFNEYNVVDNITDVAVTSDDVYKRILTWHFWKGDGRHTSAEWLKRRIVRFLNGANGADAGGSQDQISVIAAGGNLSVTIVTGTRKMVGGQINTFAFNDEGGFNATPTRMLTTRAVPPLAFAFQEAVQTGVLEMPEQYNITCRIGILGVR